MTKIYIVRHCEAMGNLERKFQGLTDLDISDLGKKQLKALSERFKDINLEGIYSSPLLRAKKTANALRGDRKIEITELKGLIEINGGVYENLKYTEIIEKFPDFKDIWSNRPHDFAPENGEKMTHAYERIWNTVLNIAKENNGKTVACATHGGVIRCLICRALKNDITKLSQIPISYNTAVSLLEFDNDLNCHISFFNDDSHITPELMNTSAFVPVK